MSSSLTGGHASGHFEPSLQFEFLPRCAQCGAAHPLARTPKLRSDACPDCGAPMARGHGATVAAVMTGGSLWTRIMIGIGRALLAIGRFFAHLGRS